MDLYQPDACNHFSEHHEDNVDYTTPNNLALEHFGDGD